MIKVKRRAIVSNASQRNILLTKNQFDVMP